MVGAWLKLNYNFDNDKLSKLFHGSRATWIFFCESLPVDVHECTETLIVHSATNRMMSI